MSTDKKKQETSYNTKERQGVDKTPGQEKSKKEKVTSDDLKGKKVDADLEKESDKPLERKP